MDRALLLALLFLVAGPPPAGAGDPVGVPVYPGAATDDATVSYCAAAAMQMHLQVQGKGLKAEVMCFRSSDAFSRVVTFYGHQPSLQRMPAGSGGGRSALFCSRGPRCSGEAGGVQVQVQSPWHAAGAERKDVIVTISTSRKSARRP